MGYSGARLSTSGTSSCGGPVGGLTGAAEEGGSAKAVPLADVAMSGGVTGSDEKCVIPTHAGMFMFIAQAGAEWALISGSGPKQGARTDGCSVSGGRSSLGR